MGKFSGRCPTKAKTKSYTSVIVRDSRWETGQGKKLARPGARVAERKNVTHMKRAARREGGRGWEGDACAHVNGNGVRKVVESVDADESASARTVARFGGMMHGTGT